MGGLEAFPGTSKGLWSMFPNERPTGYRPQLKHYVVSVEGGVTEREYFNRIKKLFWGRCNITILGKKTESCPDDVIAHI